MEYRCNKIFSAKLYHYTKARNKLGLATFNKLEKQASGGLEAAFSLNLVKKSPSTKKHKINSISICSLNNGKLRKDGELTFRGCA